jgi:hypothetical protein
MSAAARLFVSEAVARFAAGFLRFWCGCDDAKLEIVRIVTSNRHEQFRPALHQLRASSVFQSPAPGADGFRALTASERESASTLRINSATPSAQCERCGRWGAVEVHHWAPQARFPDAELWPKAQLCRDCHVLWHQVMDREVPW